MTYEEYEALYAQWQRADEAYYAGRTNTPPGRPPAKPAGYDAWRSAGKPGNPGNYSDTNPYQGGGGGGGDAPSQEDFDVVEQVLAENPWMRELEGIYDLLTELVIQDTPTPSIAAQIRDTQVWRDRFSGITQRQQAGLEAIDEATYLQLESGYYAQLREAGILGTLGLNNTSRFREWAAERIGANVSVGEINRRIDQGIAIAHDAAPIAQQTFRDFYGVEVSDDALLLWALDEDKGLQEIERQIAAARVGAEAFRFGLNITRTRAELLQREGITADFARRGFADVAREEPQLRRLARIHSTTELAQEELEDFFFHEDPEVQRRRQRTFSQALAEFQGTPGGVSRDGGLSALVDRNRTV